MRFCLVFLISLFFSLSFATPKKKLKDCQAENIELRAIIKDLLNKDSASIVIVPQIEENKAKKTKKQLRKENKSCNTTKNDVKIQKAKEKTKRKKNSNDRKLAIKKEKGKTNRNPFVNIRRVISQNSWVIGLVSIAFIFFYFLLGGRLPFTQRR